ncbi:MAG TPA: aldo/keto reductase [Geminicoccaceae bacterium]
MRADLTRRLGRTDLELTQLGFGGAPHGNMYAPFPDEVALAAIRACLDAGIRFFDTAPLYGFGLSEHRVGEALRGLGRDGYVLSTKVGRRLEPVAPEAVDRAQFKTPMPFRIAYDYGYDGVMRSFEDSLQRIGTHRIDVLLVHDLDVWTHGSETARQERVQEFMAGGYRAMRALRDQGVVGAVGAGVNEAAACRDLAERGEFDAFLLAGRYSLLEQDPLESFLPFCVERGIGLIIGGAFNSGILATGARDGATYNYRPAPPEILERTRRLEAVCARHDVPLASAALQFPLHHPAVASVIVGMRSPEEVKRNLETLGRPLPADLWAELKREGLLRPDAPTP